jgi:hypothetical protein
VEGSTDTLIDYIMNEYELKESDGSDMLNPSPQRDLNTGTINYLA